MKYLLALLVLISFNANAHDSKSHGADVLKIYAEEDFSPFNYYDDNYVFKGASVEIVDEILEKAKFKHTNIKVIPWARAYHLTQIQPNSLLFSIYKTPLRDDLFEWLGPIAKSKLVLLVKKGHNIDPKTFTIAAVRASASLQTAQDIGIPESRIVKLNEVDLGLKLLNLNRVDAWAISLINARKLLKDNNLNMDDFYIYKTMAEREIYFAFNKQTSPDTINFFTEKLEELKKSGFIKKVLEKYNVQ